MENNHAYLLRMEITKSHLNYHICQHCGVKTSTVTHSLYYVFNISLSCNINIPSFIGNLWWDLLLGNHLKIIYNYKKYLIKEFSVYSTFKNTPLETDLIAGRSRFQSLGGSTTKQSIPQSLFFSLLWVIY